MEQWPIPGIVADLPEDAAIERIADQDLPEGWSALCPREQNAIRLLGDAWVARQQSTVLSVPSDLRLIPLTPLTDKESRRKLV